MRIFSLVFTIFLLLSATSVNSTRQEYLNDALLCAIKHGQHEEALNLLEQGANPNVSQLSFDPFRIPALAYVVESEDEALLETMLDKGGKADTAMYHVTRGNDDASLRMADLCLKHGANILEPGLLKNAISKGNLRMVQFLLDEGANAKDSELIKSAIVRGKVEVVKLLLDKGADYQADSHGRYGNEKPYFFAYYWYIIGIGYVEVRRANLPDVKAFLEERGVNPNEPCFLGKSLKEWSTLLGDKDSHLIWDPDKLKSSL